MSSCAFSQSGNYFARAVPVMMLLTSVSEKQRTNISTDCSGMAPKWGTDICVLIRFGTYRFHRYRCHVGTGFQYPTLLSILNWLNVHSFNRTLQYMKCWSCMLSSAIVMTDHNMRLLPLALWSVNPRFELPTVFIFSYLKVISYLVAFCVQNCAKTLWDKVFTCSCHCKKVSNSICL